MSLKPALVYHFVLLITWDLSTLITPASDVSAEPGFICLLYAFLRLKVIRE